MAPSSKTAPVDLCIVGGGVAGLSAAIFARRRGLETMLVSKDLGGQTASTSEIENYPGLGRIEGPDLIERFYREALGYGCEVHLNVEVSKLSSEDDIFCIDIGEDVIFASTVILAFGKTPRDLGIPGEKEFRGKGLYYSVVSEAGEMSGKRVAVIGGGNSALEAALRLQACGAKVSLIHRRSDFRGEQILVDRLHAAPQIELLTPYIPKAFVGPDTLRELILEHVESAEERSVPLDAVFPAIGFEPRVSCVKDFVHCTESGLIAITTECATSVPGVFAAGDVTTVPYQQIVVSAGEGAKAALSAAAYLSKIRGVRLSRVDWGFR
ncbi:MAG: FAD-dependent oxidoreductase [Patescibacteria group bacterium]